MGTKENKDLEGKISDTLQLKKVQVATSNAEKLEKWKERAETLRGSKMPIIKDKDGNLHWANRKQRRAAHKKR